MRSALEAFQQFLSRRVWGPASCSISFLFQTGAGEDTEESKGSEGDLRRPHPAVRVCGRYGQTDSLTGPPGNRRDGNLERSIQDQCFPTHGSTIPDSISKLPLLLCHLSKPSEEKQLCINSNVNVFPGVTLSCFPHQAFGPLLDVRGRAIS